MIVWMAAKHRVDPTFEVPMMVVLAAGLCT